MNRDEKRVALAKLDGWEAITSFDNETAYHKDGIVAIYPNKQDCNRLPDYIGDLNAMHRLLGKLTDNQWELFADEVLFGENPKGAHSNYSSVRTALTRSPEQIADALLKALDLWTE